MFRIYTFTVRVAIPVGAVIDYEKCMKDTLTDKKVGEMLQGAFYESTMYYELVSEVETPKLEKLAMVDVAEPFPIEEFATATSELMEGWKEAFEAAFEAK
jgi:hypothetical protein